MHLFVNDIPVRIWAPDTKPEDGSFNTVINAAKEPVTKAKLLNHVYVQNVTLEQHAAWLAEAAALASQSGKVRLMIVWNVDFTVYGGDPQAGYAMIRADGSCPACDAMARAR